MIETNAEIVASSAAEYIMTRPDGKSVALTDETFGFGFVTFQCENGINCSGEQTTTTTTTTTASSLGL